jgi:hypothetical protein
MRKLAISLVALLLLLLNSPLAPASSDKYQTLASQVSYGIYKPSNTLGLKSLNFEVRPCRLFPKRDKYLLAGFGGTDHGIALVETSAQYNCTGVDNPQPLGTTTINGIRANVGIYCTSKNCTKSDFMTHGGEITFVTPKTKTRASTYIRVGTQGGFSLNQLIAFANGLKLVTVP